MAQRPKAIITCAPTGAIHTPSMSPHLPVTADEIAHASIEAARAGAAILHLHARDPKDGRPSQDPDLFRPFLSKIKAATDAVINITTGGSPHMSVEERMRPATTFKPELASLNMGSMNFGIFHVTDKITEWKYPWEKAYVERTKENVVSNSFAQIERFVKELGDGCGTRFECECYDIGHLYTLAHFVDRKLLKPPFFVQTIFGVLGGIGPHPEDLAHMRRTADRLFGSDYQWSILAAGRHQMSLATMGATMGANVRVGLEDSIYLGPGQLAKSNAEQVTKIRAILENLSLEIATPAEARAMLKLKGGDQVAF